MKILCRDVVIQGTTGKLSTALPVGTAGAVPAVHMAPLPCTPPQQARHGFVHNPQHYNYSL
jgi:hypothetical protein